MAPSKDSSRHPTRDAGINMIVPASLLIPLDVAHHSGMISPTVPI
jgi:hypothetical protein